MTSSQLLLLGSKDLGRDTRVGDLQQSLRKVGVLPSNESVHAGVFDGHTSNAVRRLQWFASNVPGVLNAGGNYVPRTPTALAVDGIAGPKFLSFLADLERLCLTVTGTLVSVNFGDLPDFSRINPNSGFHALMSNNKQIALCDRDFAAILLGINRIAMSTDVYVFVNQVFRPEGSTVSGAVVPPASYSAHKIGHAIDLQLGTSFKITADNPKPAISIKNAAPGTAFQKFRDGLKTSLKCRYGGDFSDIDPPHFDTQISPAGGPKWKFVFFFNQLQYSQGRNNPNAIPYYK